MEASLTFQFPHCPAPTRVALTVPLPEQRPLAALNFAFLCTGLLPTADVAAAHIARHEAITGNRNNNNSNNNTNSNSNSSTRKYAVAYATPEAAAAAGLRPFQSSAIQRVESPTLIELGGSTSKTIFGGFIPEEHLSLVAATNMPSAAAGAAASSSSSVTAPFARQAGAPENESGNTVAAVAPVVAAMTQLRAGTVLCANMGVPNTTGSRFYVLLRDLYTPFDSSNESKASKGPARNDGLAEEMKDFTPFGFIHTGLAELAARAAETAVRPKTFAPLRRIELVACELDYDYSRLLALAPPPPPPPPAPALHTAVGGAGGAGGGLAAFAAAQTGNQASGGATMFGKDRTRVRTRRDDGNDDAEEEEEEGSANPFGGKNGPSGVLQFSARYPSRYVTHGSLGLGAGRGRRGAISGPSSNGGGDSIVSEVLSSGAVIDVKRRRTEGDGTNTNSGGSRTSAAAAEELMLMRQRQQELAELGLAPSSSLNNNNNNNTLESDAMGIYAAMEAAYRSRVNTAIGPAPGSSRQQQQQQQQQGTHFQGGGATTADNEEGGDDGGDGGGGEYRVFHAQEEAFFNDIDSIRGRQNVRERRKEARGKKQASVNAKIAQRRSAQAAREQLRSAAAASSMASANSGQAFRSVKRKERKY